MKHFLFTAALMASSMTAFAQSVPTHEMYVDFGVTDKSDLVSMLDKWKPGSKFSKDAKYVDENFFISRVPLKQRFTNPATQANPSLKADNAKNLCWCVPIGEMTKKWGPLPRWNFDGDNFNMWQYINIHANWSNSWWRTPGAFNDVAHKNGVRTGCLYFIDWGAQVTENTDAGKMLGQLCAKDAKGNFKYARKLITFLRYYGIDGIGLNPEGSWSSTLNNNFQSFLAECHKVAEEMNFPFHVEWYAYVSNAGNLSDNGCKLSVGSNDKWFQKDGHPVTDVFFLNYNWSENGLSTSAEAARSLGRSTFDVYAGFDQQGRGYGKYGNGGWQALMRQPVSVVVWGGHDRSQIYAGSTEGGNSDLSVQKEYQTKQELLFTGATRNVLNTPAIYDGVVNSSYSSLKNWHGYSKAVLEQSTLTELPFVTRFGLGNGLWLKKQGETTFSHKWYNIGMQDYLPTWRWWIDNGDGHTVPADAIKADFTFEDAWTGGSCLKLHGATKKSHLRLFNTQFKVESPDDALSLTFKVNSGTDPKLRLTASIVGAESKFKSVAVPAEGVVRGEWKTVSLKASDLGLAAGNVIACLGLEVEGTDAAYETLLGEYSYIPSGFSETPVQPEITHAEVMKRVYNRADVKVVFNVPFDGTRKPEYVDCPVYNEEVGAWYYEIYVKQGEEQKLVATTTSWASYVVDAPLNGKDATLQIGVRSVGRDGRTESPITWSKELTSKLSIIENLTIDKDIIKPNEEFTVGFEDPNHAVADIEIQNSLTGEVMAKAEGKLSLTASLPETGTYDVKVTSGGKTTISRALILITPEATGRLPQVAAITADRTEVDGDNRDVHFKAEVSKGTTFKRGGKDVPCTVSKSLYMKEPYQLTVDSKVMSEYKNTSFALWFKVEKFEHASLGTLLMTKVNRNYPGTWTEKVWGEMWTAIRPAGFGKNMPNRPKVSNGENELSVSVDAPPAGTYNYEHNLDVDGLTKGYELSPNTWYHCCVVKTDKNIKLYLNGKCVINTVTRGAGPKDWKGANFYVGGSMTNLASFTGWVDEVQIWSKSLSEDEVREAMNGYVIAPDNLEGYFTFETQETDADGNIYFPNEGNAAAAVKGAYMTTGQDKNGKNTDIKQNQLTTALGVPAIEGTLPITFESSKWMLDGAQLSNATETEATGTYHNAGTYPVTLSLTNSWGTTTRTIEDYIVVKSSTGIDNVATSEGYRIYPRPFEGKVNLLFAEEGNYEVKAFDASGRCVSQRAYQALSGEVSELSMQGAKGTYVITILKDGKCVRSVKVSMK